MADYQQVLAVHADVARKKKRTWADVEPQFGLCVCGLFFGVQDLLNLVYYNLYVLYLYNSAEKHGLIDADQEDLMILLPSRFSLKDTPENLV